MDSELPFRIALGLVFVLTMTVGAYHRVKAAASGEKISHEAEGYAFAITLRLAGVCLGLVALAYLFFPASIRWASMPLPIWVRWLATVSGLLCSGLMCWTLSSLGKNLTDTVVTRRDATLVTHGPYRWIRHPFYLTAALLMASATLISANGLLGVTGVIVLSLLAVRTPKEEQMLIERFGQAYRDYAATTGRYLPKWFSGRG